MNSPNGLPTVLYIAGIGRSGSTLLDTLLGNHPEMFGAGELTHLFDDVASSRTCSCGRSYDACDFWREVMGRARKGLPGFDPRRVAEVTRGLESLPARSVNRDLYGSAWRAVLQAIRAVGERTVLVDSSKSTRLSHWRVRRLETECGAACRVVHLVRDPRGVMWSVRRGSNQALEAGRASRPVTALMLRTVIGWIWVNKSVSRQHGGRGPGSYLQVRYEDLVVEPEREVGKVLDLAGTEERAVEPLLKTVDPGHGVRGNRMRRAGPIVIRRDDEWVDGLPGHLRALAWIAWPLARHYGYNLRFP
jgi:hypothetical protein